MSQRSSISTTLKIAILPYALSIFPFLCVSELHGALSGHIFEETAERSLVFKSQNIGNLFGAFVAVKQETLLYKRSRLASASTRSWITRSGEGSLQVEKMFDSVLGDLCNISA